MALSCGVQLAVGHVCNLARVHCILSSGRILAPPFVSEAAFEAASRIGGHHRGPPSIPLLDSASLHTCRAAGIQGLRRGRAGHHQHRQGPPRTRSPRQKVVLAEDLNITLPAGLDGTTGDAMLDHRRPPTRSMVRLCRALQYGRRVRTVALNGSPAWAWSAEVCSAQRGAYDFGSHVSRGMASRSRESGEMESLRS